MWFFIAVLILWGSTAMLGRWDSWVLAPIVEWAWWTLHLYVCAAAAFYDNFHSLLSRVLGLFGYTMVSLYYLTMQEIYLTFIPTDTANPDLWPTIFLSVNLLAPLAMITVGCLSPAVQKRGE